MKALVYRNKEKDKNKKYSNILAELLDKYKIEFSMLEDSDLKSLVKADILFIIGGDGTILDLTEFANVNNIPIIGINAGKVGFLTEFENDQMEEAVKLFSENLLEKDFRNTILAEYKNKKYYALNDVVIQRVYTEERGAHITNVDVAIDGCKMDRISGDGVIVSTPTGSTAYSLSASGSIMTPGINAFSVTPICAHSLHHRSVIYSAESVCSINMLKGSLAGLFIDGNYIGLIDSNDEIVVKKAERPTVFLRKNDYNFFEKLIKKLNSKVIKNV